MRGASKRPRLDRASGIGSLTFTGPGPVIVR